MLAFQGWTRGYVMTPRDVDHYTDIILGTLTERCTRDNGATEFQGAPVSRVVSELRGRRCVVPGKWCDQCTMFEALGFKLVRARPKWGFRNSYQKECEVVTL
jgi:hypothetical protein